MLIDGTGVLLGDEIGQSSDPRAHAHGIIETMKRQNVQWVAQQINDPASREWMQWLNEGARIYAWGSVGSWAQGIPSTLEVSRAVGYGSRFHLANVESPGEDDAWLGLDMERLQDAMPDGCGVIFTEGAWGRDPRKTVRWRQRGFYAIPEAILSENPQATIPAMLDLAIALGWKQHQTAPLLYLNNKKDGSPTPASTYSPTIHQTMGRWSIFRYGDIGPDDWPVISTWPRPVSEPDMPDPTPPPSGGGMYSELERLVNLFRASSPNIAKAFDEVEKILKVHDKAIQDINQTLDDVREALG